MIVRSQVRQILCRGFATSAREINASRSRIHESCTCSTNRQARLVSMKEAGSGPQFRMASTSSHKIDSAAEHSPFPILNRISDFRKWRGEIAAKGRSVGFVPTMGALHDGHLNLVRQSLAENDETVISIFVNPAQFAPTEDLSSYPRTLSSDIQALSSLQSIKGKSGISAIFTPTVSEMYPSPDGQPFTQHVEDQIGAFVQVKGLEAEMEGSSRPTFFRGVTTICTKLFHIVEPNLAYFGQKDIQQAIILRRLVSDLLFSYPPSAKAIRIIKTTRDENDGLALSSRNAYLTKKCRIHASILYKSLCSAKKVWDESKKNNKITNQLIQSTLLAANETAQEVIKAAQLDDVSIEVLYISLNDPITLQNLNINSEEASIKNRGAILSAAAFIKQGQDGRVTRLIDNFLLDFSM